MLERQLFPIRLYARGMGGGGGGWQGSSSEIELNPQIWAWLKLFLIPPRYQELKTESIFVHVFVLTINKTLGVKNISVLPGTP